MYFYMVSFTSRILLRFLLRFYFSFIPCLIMSSNNHLNISHPKLKYLNQSRHTMKTTLFKSQQFDWLFFMVALSLLYLKRIWWWVQTMIHGLVNSVTEGVSVNHVLYYSKIHWEDISEMYSDMKNQSQIYESTLIWRKSKCWRFTHNDFFNGWVEATWRHHTLQENDAY